MVKPGFNMSMVSCACLNFAMLFLRYTIAEIELKSGSLQYGSWNSVSWYRTPEFGSVRRIKLWDRLFKSMEIILKYG